MAEVVPLERGALAPTSHKISLPVEGMTCASCVAHVEKALKAVPGVAGRGLSQPCHREGAGPLCTEHGGGRRPRGGDPQGRLRAPPP